MKKIILLLSVFILVAGFFHSAGAVNYGIRKVSLDQHFELAMHETVQVGDYPIRLEYLSLTNNSTIANIKIYHPYGFYTATFTEKQLKSYQGALMMVNNIDKDSVQVFLSASQLPHSPGTNIQAGGTVWFINSDYERQAYTSAGAFLSYGFNRFESVVEASEADLLLPQADLVPPADGKIICSDRDDDKGTCYLITEGKKAGFISAQVFTALGYRFDRALSGDVSFLLPAPVISSATERHRTGTLVNYQGTVGYIVGNGYVLFPSMGVFQSWGFSFVDVVPANPADAALVNHGILAGRQSAQLNPDPIGGSSPIVDLKINGFDGVFQISEGSDLNLTWTSHNATNCAFGGNGELLTDPQFAGIIRTTGAMTLKNISRGINNHNMIELVCDNNTVMPAVRSVDRVFVEVVR